MLISYTEQSIQDLREVFDFIALDSKSRALSYIEKIQQKIELLSQFPEMGVECRSKKLTIDCRILIFGDYLVFYRVSEESVVISRVIHCSVNYLSSMDT